MDVQPLSDASFPDWNSSSSASSQTPGAFATPSIPPNENAAPSCGGGNGSAAETTRLAPATPAHSIIVPAIDRAPNPTATTIGTNSAPTPKKVPSRFSIRPRLSG